MDFEQRLEEANSELPKEYFEVNEKMDRLYSSIFKQGVEFNNIGFGNKLSKLVAIINFEKTSDNNFLLLKTFFDINNKDVYKDVYIINFNKTNDKKLNIGILKNELKILCPERVLNITDIEIKNSKTFNLKEVEYNAFVDKRYLNIENELCVPDVKKNITSGFKFLITGMK